MTPHEKSVYERMSQRASQLKAQYKRFGSPWLFEKWQKAERSLKVKKAELKMKHELSPQLNIQL
jgi:hypothetical protein